VKKFKDGISKMLLQFTNVKVSKAPIYSTHKFFYCNV